MHRLILCALTGALLVIATGCPKDEPQKATPNPGGDSVVHAGSRAKLKTDMLTMKKMCESHFATEGVWPETLEDVVATKLLRHEQTLDPWGNQYLIEQQGSTVRVYTLGADGEEGGEEADRDWSTDDL
ncbi:MAG: type II secretion system protein GspG [Planctomycetes bacterium]|nr:type II secretion system protein GspG [Planctomycetota bacterium]